MPSRILFAPIHGPSLLEMLPVAQKIAADGNYEPIFFIFREIPQRQFLHLVELDIRQIRLRNLENTVGKGEVGSDSRNADEEVSNPSIGIKKRIVTGLLSRQWISFFFYLLKYKRLLAQSRRLLVAENVDAVLVMGDRHVGWETALIEAANERGLGTLIVPFAISDPDSDIQGRLRKAESDRYRVSSLMDRLIRRFYPDWVRESPKGSFFFIPVGEALAAQVMGMMPQRPWSIGGGAARRMAVESPLSLENYLKEGIPRQKMVVTGKPSNDQIADQMNQVNFSALRTELGLQKDQQMMLCSVPQLAEHKLLTWEDHWQEIEFLFASLCQVEGARTILSLHPQSEPGRYRELAEQYGAVIANRRIYELIPICDFLVATYSSVVVQAIGCGKPALVVDFYGLDFTYYDQEPGVVILKDRNILVPTVNRLVRDRSYYQRLAEAQKRRAREWIVLDGGSTQRVVDELYQMLKK